MPILGEAKVYDAESKVGLIRAKHRLARVGHVGLSNVYDPTLAGKALERVQSRTNRIFPTQHFVEVGVEAATKADLKLAQDDGGLGTLRAAIFGRAARLGHDLATSRDSGREPIDQIIYLQPGQRSGRHGVAETDGPIVAFTALSGESCLEFGDKPEPRFGTNEYSVTPGTVVIFDRSAGPFRYGAETPQNQTGIPAWGLGYLLTEHPASRVL